MSWGLASSNPGRNIFALAHSTRPLHMGPAKMSGVRADDASGKTSRSSSTQGTVSRPPGYDVGVGDEHEMGQPGEEVACSRLAERKGSRPVQRQVHPDADALHPLACLRRPRPFVGGLHHTWAAAGDDFAVHSAQGRAHLVDLFVNPVPRLRARGPEHRHAIALVLRRRRRVRLLTVAQSPKSVSRG